MKSLDFILLVGFISFIGSIGHFMRGAGLSEALVTIYGENAVNTMISGKSIARALRGIFLTDRVLTIEIEELLLLGNVIDREDNDSIQNEKNKLRNEDITIGYNDQKNKDYYSF